jgi:hypothetical protein
MIDDMNFGWSIGSCQVLLDKHESTFIDQAKTMGCAGT